MVKEGEREKEEEKEAFFEEGGEATGFPKKDARFLKIKDIANLLSDDKEGKIMKNIDF